jgi:HD superfamily phosphohydrolase
MPKAQRIRDPIHDLIEFGDDQFEQMAWSLLEAPEFQRLRRIRQLGFSELVFPGATHSRFAHSVGVFHTARQLARHIEAEHANANPERAQTAMAAALVHDLGHGPFSHAFETAAKKLVPKARHEEWTIEIVRGDTPVGRILESFRAGFREEVAQIIADDTPQDIYGSIVSSQFDADRLDYVRRDRMMCGVHHGVFDFSWLMANLEVDQIPVARDEETIGNVHALVLGRKAFQAAESYVLGLFHLYFTVYFHKATRSAEKMLTAVLLRIGELVRDGKSCDCGVTDDHPIVAFIKEGTLAQYLSLDDFIFWAAFQQMMSAKDEIVKELATRLIQRKLYKAIDVSALLEHRGGEAAVARFKGRLGAAKKAGTFGPIDLFEDTATRNPYKRRGFETPEALSKVLIRLSDGTSFEDLRDCSKVVKALEETTGHL